MINILLMSGEMCNIIWAYVFFVLQNTKHIENIFQV